MTAPDVSALDFAKGDGLIPAVVQDARTGCVLMLGYVDEAAYRKTVDERRVTFFSRSRGRLWTKGETSGHFLDVEDIRADCDRDALLVRARPHGPVCHTGAATCFDEANPSGSAPANPPGSAPASEPGVGFLAELEGIVRARRGADPASSYTARLFAEGVGRMAQKVGEEGVEVALAAVGGDREALVGEAADLLFHLAVLLEATGASLSDAVRVLEARHAA